MRVTRTFSMSQEIADFIDQFPRNERSKFVTNVLAKAKKEKSKADLSMMLHNIEPIPSDQGSVELLEQFRNQRQDYLLNRNP